MKSVRDADVHEKKVFLRVDFNVPMKEGKIVGTDRIEKATPTIKYLLDRKAKIVLGTHLGRPEGKFNPEFSTIPIAKELTRILNQEVFATDHVIDPTVTKQIDKMTPGQIFLIGNLRFDPREEENDEAFAKELAGLAEVYVNDAFAVCHRSNASVDAITKFLPSYSGLLLESEITSLSLLMKNPVRPFVLIVGGAKVEDKAGVLSKISEMADSVLIGGAVGNTFLAAKGEDISKSLSEQEMIPECKKILEKFGSKIKLPTDSIKKTEADGSFSILDIGQQTRSEFIHEISYAETVFWNGNMGYTEDKSYAGGTRAVAEALSKNTKRTVVAGGDTVGFLDSLDLAKNVSFVSTGGGATMDFLAGEKMPGLLALERNAA